MEFLINDQREETVILAATQRHLYFFHQETVEQSDLKIKPYFIPIVELSAITMIKLSPKQVGLVTILYNDENYQERTLSLQRADQSSRIWKLIKKLTGW